MVLKNKKFGFTLAEVMLTLTLIGALATLTVSTIGGSVQQRARLSEFRAAYAKLESALRSVSVDDGKIYRCYVVPSAAEKAQFGLTDKIAEDTTNANADCATFDAVFSKAMGTVKTCNGTPQTNKCLPNNYPRNAATCFTDPNSGRAYVFDNGMIMWTNAGYSGMQNFAVDINGRSAPNKWGQDIFAFSIKITESVKNGNKVIPKQVSIMPPACQPAVTSSSKTTAQMMAESINYK